MIYDVDIVPVPGQAVVSLRARGPISAIGERMRRLRDVAGRAGLAPAGSMMARFYDTTSGLDQDYDVCLPVNPRPDGSIPDSMEEARGELIPLHHVLQAEHRGPHGSMQDAWRAVREACAALGYTPSGPVTEVYVTGKAAGAAPEDYVTLVRLPYAR